MATATIGATTTRAEIKASIAAAATPELADKLIEEFEELNRRFHLADFRPSELSGGRFGEVVYRICQQVCLGKHTAVGKTLPKTDQIEKELEQSPAASVDPTFRIHIPRTLRLIYDLRNKRDVAHLGSGTVSPNFTDASLILGCAAWVVSEIVRVSHKCDIKAAQQIVDGLVQRRVPLIWTEGDLVRVLKPSLKPEQQVLVILYHFDPEWVSEADLFRWVEHKHITRFRENVLGGLHKKALIQYTSDKCKILPPGLKFVEESPDLRNL